MPLVANKELFSPSLLVEVFSSQRGLRVNGLRVLEEARVGRNLSWEGDEVKVVATGDLGVVVLLGLPAGNRLSVKENGNKWEEGGAVA